MSMVNASIKLQDLSQNKFNMQGELSVVSIVNKASTDKIFRMVVRKIIKVGDQIITESL